MTSDPPSPSPERFATTCWTHVLSVRGSSEESREALSELCERYYEPVLAFLRRSGMTPEQARDLAHDFFADILSTQRFTHLDRKKGKFRSYLLEALKHFLSRQRARATARKRGGGRCRIALSQRDGSRGEAGPVP